ncbi:MAG: hypothetical protein KDB13_05035, partial [Microthrixaceae bacterium]|nr:hypothetical protein [Microthrixaceae bacterium]
KPQIPTAGADGDCTFPDVGIARMYRVTGACGLQEWTMDCPSCGDELVEIGLTVDGHRLTMVSCSECDTRSWHRDGDAVELDGVLTDLSATKTRYRRSLAN